MFTNPIFSSFFRSGQVIETFRGRGIYQPAVNDAVRKLDDGAWIHLFPEGYVNQPSLNPSGELFRFRWGVGRIIMNTHALPTIIPMWLSGFDKLMPEPRSFPKFIPRLSPRNEISITFGRPIDFTASSGLLPPSSSRSPPQLTELGERLEKHRQRRRPNIMDTTFKASPFTLQSPGPKLSDRLLPSRRRQLLDKRIGTESELAQSLDYAPSTEEEVVQVRRDVTAYLQECVNALGRPTGKQSHLDSRLR